MYSNQYLFGIFFFIILLLLCYLYLQHLALSQKVNLILVQRSVTQERPQTTEGEEEEFIELECICETEDGQACETECEACNVECEACNVERETECEACETETEDCETEGEESELENKVEEIIKEKK